MLEMMKKKYSEPEIEFVFSLNGDIMSLSGNDDEHVGKDDEGWFDWV